MENIRRIADGGNFTAVRLLKRLTPTPHLPVFLEITPLESFARKGEYSVPYLRKRWDAYKTVFPWVRSGVTLANGDLNDAKAVLQRVVMERLGTR